MALKAGKVISFLEELAPGQLQADWDNSGLQVGDRGWPVDRILIALDVTVDVVRYAVENNFNFVIAHHPIIFKKLSRIDGATPIGQIISLALANQITIYGLHTNLDIIWGGVSDVLANLINLEKVEVLEKRKGDYYKLSVFVPATHLEKVRQAMGDAGAGWIGNYSHCSFASEGKGRFLPREGSNPWLGSLGNLEEVDEIRLETLVEGFKLSRVLAAMKTAHPYEELAYDVLPTVNDAGYGLGRIGVLPESQTLDQFTAMAGRALGCSSLRVTSEGSRKIKRVAVCGGSGGDFVGLAYRKGADVLVTGDIGHHQALEALQLGLALVDPGHHHSEYPVLITIQSYLKKMLKGVDIALYPGDTNPFRVELIKL